MYLSKDEREFYTEFDEPDAPWDELLSRNDVAVYQCVKKVKGKYLLKKIWQRDDLKKEELKELSKLHNERWLSEKYIKEFMKMTSNQEQKLIQDMYKKIRGWNK